MIYSIIMEEEEISRVFLKTGTYKPPLHGLPP